MTNMYQRVETNQQAPRNLDQFAPLIHKYSFKFAKRATGLGCAMELDDIRQELSLVFVKCCNSYDETKGGSFMNFLISAWFNEMNRLMSRDQRNREVGYTMRADSCGEEGEESFSLFDLIDSGHASPEENLSALSSMNEGLRNLSEPARMLVELLVDPPDIVCQHFDAQLRGAASRREAGMASRSTKHLNLTFLGNLFDIPRTCLKDLQAEIANTIGSAFAL